MRPLTKTTYARLLLTWLLSVVILYIIDRAFEGTIAFSFSALGYSCIKSIAIFFIMYGVRALQKGRKKVI